MEIVRGKHRKERKRACLYSTFPYVFPAMNTKNTTKLPKPARGCSHKGHIRINSRQLAKLFTNPHFRFTGFIVGNKVAPFHYFGGWHLACTLDGKSKEEMQSAINSFCFYLDPELGNNAAIFVRPSAIRRGNDPVFPVTTPVLL